MTGSAFPFHTLIETLKKTFKNSVPIVTKISQTERNNPFLVLIGTLLSLRTKDETTELVLKKLIKQARTPDEIIKIPITRLQKILYPVGFYRKKSKILKYVSHLLLKKYDGKVPDSLEKLLTIKGVGRKTANLVITEAFNKPGICVDTHVHRISNRMGIVSTKNPHETEQELLRILPKQYWIIYNRLLVKFGQTVCKPISPLCSTCPVTHLCKHTNITSHR